MFTQSQVLRTLRAADLQVRFEAVLSDARLRGRAAMARGVCASFDFVDACGRWQVASYVKALATLEDRGLVALRAPTNEYAAGIGLSLLPEPVPRCTRVLVRCKMYRAWPWCT